MEAFTEYIMAGVGHAISTITFFLKKEAKRLTMLEQKIDENQEKINDNARMIAEKVANTGTILAQNDTRDKERWDRLKSELETINKKVEQRREAEIKLWDAMAKK